VSSKDSLASLLVNLGQKEQHLWHEGMGGSSLQQLFQSSLGLGRLTQAPLRSCQQEVAIGEQQTNRVVCAEHRQRCLQVVQAVLGGKVLDHGPAGVIGQWWVGMQDLRKVLQSRLRLLEAQGKHRP
jgi:hypothetical protein